MTGYTAPHPPTRADLRASDTERDAVAAELADHLKDGRLTVAEFEERMGQAIGARTWGELDGLLADLPRRAVAPPASQPHRPGWPFALIPLSFVLLVMVAGAAGRASGGGPGGHWHGGPPVWGLWWLAWLVPVALLVTIRRWRRGGTAAPRLASPRPGESR